MSTAAALAVALPSAGLVVAFMAAMWHSLNSRLDEHGRRLDGFDQRFGTVGGRIDTLDGRIDEVAQQQGEILRALGRIEGHLRIPAEPAGAA